MLLLLFCGSRTRLHGAHCTPTRHGSFGKIEKCVGATKTLEKKIPEELAAACLWILNERRNRLGIFMLMLVRRMKQNKSVKIPRTFHLKHNSPTYLNITRSKAQRVRRMATDNEIEDNVRTCPSTSNTAPATSPHHFASRVHLSSLNGPLCWESCGCEWVGDDGSLFTDKSWTDISTKSAIAVTVRQQVRYFRLMAS